VRGVVELKEVWQDKDADLHEYMIKICMDIKERRLFAKVAICWSHLESHVLVYYSLDKHLGQFIVAICMYKYVKIRNSKIIVLRGHTNRYIFEMK